MTRSPAPFHRPHHRRLRGGLVIASATVLVAGLTLAPNNAADALLPKTSPNTTAQQAGRAGRAADHRAEGAGRPR